MRYLSENHAYSLFGMAAGYVALVSAPTGAGKTTMILQHLWPLCRKHRKWLLLVVNRLSLRSQILKNICNILGIPSFSTEEGFFNFDYLTVVSYQYLQVRLKDNLQSADKFRIGGICCSSYSYIVFDEAHYFFCDSTFSLDTIYLSRLPRLFKSSARVYMSATMKPIRDMLLRFEDIQDCEWNPYCQEWAYPGRFFTNIPFVGNIPRMVKEFSEVIPDYSYFDPVPFKEDENIGQIIVEAFESGDKGHWIVFVNSKDSGQEIKKYLLEHGVSCAFIAAKGTPHVDESVIEDISSKAKFKQQVLLTTNVIDNGVSLHDRELTHMVLSGVDEITAVQQAGRIRVKNKKRTKIQLWICLRSKKYFSALKYNLKNDYDYLLDFEKASIERKSALLFQTHPNNLQNYVLCKEKKFIVNRFAKEALRYRIMEYSRNLKWLEQKGEYGFYDRVLSWFGLNRKEPCSEKATDSTYLINRNRLEMIQAEKVKLFEEYIKTHMMTGLITKEQLDEYATSFKVLHDEAFGAYEKNQAKRPYGIHILNKILKRYELHINSKTVSENGNRVTKYFFEEVDKS